jgi:hypothetical protein
MIPTKHEGLKAAPVRTEKENQFILGAKCLGHTVFDQDLKYFLLDDKVLLVLRGEVLHTWDSQKAFMGDVSSGHTSFHVV